ncbi:uncharacterized protein JCM6883_003845 [Sporobolomyces salmoneus]|uniref:uncharacterized protein n=1 Tax=Sporobolomyces salmoneus TaxID=183962 RepID=UPI00316FA3DB
MAPRLPYDVLREIFRHLDPVPDNDSIKLITTPSSSLAIQRSNGAIISRISHEWRDLGYRMMFSNVLLQLGYEKHQRKMILLTGNEEIAKNVKRLFISATEHDWERLQSLPIDFLLPSLSNLERLEIVSPWPVILKVFSQVDFSPNGDLRNLRHLVLDNSGRDAIRDPVDLTRLVSKLPHLVSLEINTPLAETGTMPPSPETRIESRPLRHLKSLDYTVQYRGPTTLAVPLFLTLWNLLDPSKLEHLSLSDRTLPETLPSILTSCPNLSTLSLSCDRQTTELQLPSLIETLYSLPKLTRLDLSLVPDWTAPFHVPSTSPLPSQLFSALSSLPHLESASFDLDLSFHEPATQAYLASQWSTGTLKRFRWNSWLAVARNRVSVEYERIEEGGWRREEMGNSFEIVGAD